MTRCFLIIFSHQGNGISQKQYRNVIFKCNKIEFDIIERQWIETCVDIHISPEHFSSGGMRLAYKGTLIENGSEFNIVAKMPKPEKNYPQEMFYQDVKTQALASLFATKYNSKVPPKLITFLDASVIKLIDRYFFFYLFQVEFLRPGKPLCSIEKYLPGVYRKHNNNYGYVNDFERHTPHAFSHFTYEASGKKLIVVDIQGEKNRFL